MKRIVTLVAGIAVAAVASGGVLAGLSGSAHAAATPPWEPDHSSVGSLAFYNSAGTKITGGSTAQPIAAYTEGGATVRAGDTVATLFGYLPVKGQVPGQWSGEQLSGSTSYPNASAPGQLGSASHPVVTGATGDETVAQLVADYPNTDTSSDGYAHAYQIRLLTSKPQEGISTTYDSADILVTGSTWSVLYSQGQTTPTAAIKVTLKASKAKIKAGKKLTLTASEKPAVAGKMTFLDGSKKVGKATVKAGKAKFSTRKLKVGKHKLKAKFTPTSKSNGATATSKVVKVKVIR